jgi:hypothetical protein
LYGGYSPFQYLYSRLRARLANTPIKDAHKSMNG